MFLLIKYNSFTNFFYKTYNTHFKIFTLFLFNQHTILNWTARSKKTFLQLSFVHKQQSRRGFPKMGQVVPLGAMTYVYWATSSKGATGAL